MTQDNKNGTTPCEPCGLRTFERNRYFDGKLLVTRDFEAEQSYLRGKSRLHSSMLHGYGTVCGLKIEEHPNPACNHQYVVLNPGLALDCCGNEIIVNEQTVVDLRHKIEQALRSRQLFNDGSPDPTDVYVRLAYLECDSEKVPALLDDCGCEGAHTEYNRTKETYRLFVSLDPPATEASDPLEARLEWQHTLGVAHPEAMAIDRTRMRLYVADWDGTEGGLRMYDASNHSLVNPRLRVGDRRPTAVAYSYLRDRVYVAESADPNTETDARVVIFDQTRLESAPAEARRAELTVTDGADVVRLEVSILDESLFALTSDGRILRWSSDQISDWVAEHETDSPPDQSQEPPPVSQNLGGLVGVVGVGPVDMSVGPNGRWMVVADGNDARLIVVHLAQPDLSEAALFSLPPGDVPTAVEFSYDGQFFYILCAQSQKLYRARLRDELATFIPIIPGDDQDFSELPLADDPDAGSPPNALPLDVSVSPRDNWAYVLRRLFNEDGSPRDRGDILIIDVNQMNASPGPGSISPESASEIRRHGAYVNGNARFHNLAFLGQRIYAAGETIPEAVSEEEGESEEPPESTEGSISILFIDEASCNTFITRTIDGCPGCDDPGEGVVIASISGYLWDQPMVEEQVAGQNYIENLTHRQMVPSTNTLRQVIECMLDKGISEGIPGPRGAVGPDGRQGQGITDVSVETLGPGSNATAALEPIDPVGDPDGDLRLLLGVPRGETGQRGPGITEVSSTPIVAGQAPTANLAPIPGDPEGDQRLELGLPPGAGIVEVTVQEGPLSATLEPVDNANPNGDQRLALTIPPGGQGEPGPRGPGIQPPVGVTTLPVGSPATATLTPIAGDPEGDLRLELGIPQGDPGPEGPPGEVAPGSFNQVINANWHHDQIVTSAEFVEMIAQTEGLIVEFRDPVRIDNLHERSAFVTVNRVETTPLGNLYCRCVVPALVEAVEVEATDDAEISWLIRNNLVTDTFRLITVATSVEDQGELLARAVRLRLPEDFSNQDILARAVREMGSDSQTLRWRLTLSITLRGDWILDENGNALDGNNIWPGVPEGPTVAGVDGRFSGNGAQGNDWVSLLHIEESQLVPQ